MHILAFLFCLLWASPALATAIGHAFAEQNTQQTTTSTTYGDVSGASITSGNFTAGKKYLLYVTYQMMEDVTGLCQYRVIHGSTAFADSESMYVRAINLWQAAHWFTVWTAVGSEDVKLQFRVSTGGSGTCYADRIAMLAINLSDDVTENTDWFFAERTNDDALSTTPTDGASITFTPSGASDWLILSNAQIDATANNQSMISRIVRSGEAASSVPEARLRPDSSEDIHAMGLSRVYSLTAAENVFKEQSESTAAATHTRLHSSIFALNLNKFRNHAFAYTEADVALSASDFATELQTLSITPDVQGDVWIGGYWGSDRQATTRLSKFRIQVDDTDQPAGQTADAYTFDPGNVATDEFPFPITTMVTNMTAAAHTVALDGSTSSVTNSPAGQHRTLWAVTMELPAATSRPRRRVITIP